MKIFSVWLIARNFAFGTLKPTQKKSYENNSKIFRDSICSGNASI